MNSKYYALFFSLLLLLAVIPFQNVVKADDSVDVDEPVFSPMSNDWWNENWSYCKEITINHSQVEGNLVNFPVCVSITDADLRDDAQSDGDDIVFVSSDNNTKYNHEMEFFDSSSGELVAWVNVSSLSSMVDTVIWMYYGNPNCINQENPTDVWDENFIAVYHMSDPSSGITDSTSNAFDSIASSGVDADDYGQTGIAASAVKYDGTGHDDNDEHHQLPDDLLTNSEWEEEYTLEAWTNVDSYSTTDTHAIVSMQETSRTELQVLRDTNSNGKSDGSQFTMRHSSGTEYTASTFELEQSTWYYIVGKNDGTYGHLLTNGGDKQSFLHDGLTTSNGNAIGSRDNGDNGNNGGSIDEVRISKIDRPDNWIATTYNTMNNATDGFFNVGDEQTQGNQFTAWQYNRSILFNSSQIPSNLINFPVCINITDNHLKDNAQSDGDDILFTMDNISKLNHEIELYNSTTGKLVVWINVTELSGNEDTVIYMYYGNSTCSNQENIYDTWNEKYEAVWHFGGESSTIYNSAKPKWNGTCIDFDGDEKVASYNDIGYAFHLDGDDLVRMPKEVNVAEGTVDFLFYLPDEDNQYGRRMWSKNSGGTNSGDFIIQFNRDGNNKIRWFQQDSNSDEVLSDSAVSEEEWHHSAMHFEGTMEAFLDGVWQADTDSCAAGIERDTEYLHFGGSDGDGSNRFNVTLDECRITNTYLSDDWIRTTFNNIENASDGEFFSLEPSGPTNTAPNTPTSPECQNATWSQTNHILDHTPYFDWSFSDNDVNDTQHGFQIQVGSDADWSVVEMWNYNSDSSDEFVVYNGTSLVDGETYYWRVRVKDNDSVWSDYTSNQQFRMNSVPTAPMLSSPSNNANNLPYQPDTIELSWSASSDAEDSGSLNYWWQYCRFPDFSCSYTNEKDGDEGWGTGNMNVTIPQTTQLYEQTDYYWRVRAYDGLEYGPWSTAWSFETDEIIELTDLSISDGATDVSTSLSEWSINITHDDGNPFDWWINTTPDIGNASGYGESDGIKSCVLSGLQPSTTYEVNVVVIGSSRNETYTFTTASGSSDKIWVTLDPQTTANITVNKSSWNPSVNIGENESTGLSFFNLDNSGNVQVDVSVNASDTMNWSIAMSPSHNQFNLSYNTGSGWNLLDTIASSFASNLAYDEDVDFGLQLFMPTSSSTNSNQQSTITFTAIMD